jgi:hypothetical protein
MIPVPAAARSSSDGREGSGACGAEQAQQDREPSQQGLQQHRRESGKRHAANNTTGLAAPDPDRQHQHQNAHRTRHHAVSVLVEHAPDHRREKPSHGERPVGYGQARTGAGDEPAREDQDKRGGSRHARKEVQPARGSATGDD